MHPGAPPRADAECNVPRVLFCGRLAVFAQEAFGTEDVWRGVDARIACDSPEVGVDGGTLWDREAFEFIGATKRVGEGERSDGVVPWESGQSQPQQWWLM